MLKLFQVMTLRVLLVATVMAEPAVLMLALPATTAPPVGRSVGAAKAGRVEPTVLMLVLPALDRSAGAAKAGKVVTIIKQGKKCFLMPLTVVVILRPLSGFILWFDCNALKVPA